MASIAYRHLSRHARQRIDQLTQVKDAGYRPVTRFLYASTWADQLRGEDVTMYNSWHYIDIPGSNVHPQNVVWAIHQMMKTLQSNYAKPQEKATALYFLIHFVGDVHQPLHVASKYNGGNTYIIDAGKCNNLHVFWDQGLGLLKAGNAKPLALAIEQQFPEKFFGAKVKDTEAYDWAGQSFAIAKGFAYDTPKYKEPNAAYVAKGQNFVKQQLALAGYRLAFLLNKIFG